MNTSAIQTTTTGLNMTLNQTKDPWFVYATVDGRSIQFVIQL